MSAETAAPGQLRAFIERAERLDEEIAALNADKRDLFAEAKGVGFDVKALKAVLGIRRKDPSERSEHNTIVALYLSTLGMADAADEIEQNDPRAHGQVQAHPRTREGEEIRDSAEEFRSSGDDSPQKSDRGAAEPNRRRPPTAGELMGAVAAPMHEAGTGGAVGGVPSEPFGRDNNSRESASEASPAASEGAQMHAVEPSPATDTAHGSVTPTAGDEGTAVRGGPALPSGPVAKSGVTAGERPGTNPRDSAPDLDQTSGDGRPPAKSGSSPQPGAGRESPGTSSPEREAAIAAIKARQGATPLDPSSPLFAIRFRARHGRDPVGDDLVTGAPSAELEVA